MGDSKFYNELKGLDPGIADRWKRYTHDSVTVPLSVDQVFELLKPLFMDNKITEKQAQAIVKLIDGTNLQGEALADLYAQIEIAIGRDMFVNGAATPMVTAAQLMPVTVALGMGSVGRVEFTSPRTGVTYTPQLYQGIAKLIQDGKIKVLEIAAAGLNERLDDRLGKYRSDINRLILYKGMPPSLGQAMIVHECTHSIQDWLDVRSVMKFNEADAYIAGCVAAKSISDGAYASARRYDALDAAVDLVLNKKATPSNPDWTRAYDAVFAAVEVDPVYIGKKDLETLWDEDGSGGEKAELNKALEWIRRTIIYGKIMGYPFTFEVSAGH